MISELNIDVDTANRMLEQAKRDVDHVVGFELSTEEYLLRALSYTQIALAVYTHALVDKDTLPPATVLIKAEPTMMTESEIQEILDPGSKFPDEYSE